MQPCVNLQEQRKRSRVFCLYHIETELEGGNDVTARQMDIFRLNKWAYLMFFMLMIGLPPNMFFILVTDLTLQIFFVIMASLPLYMFFM